MTFPRQAIEACEALSQPLPHPSTDDLITGWLHQKDGGAKVDTTHPGPIEMLDEPDEYEAATMRDLLSIWLVVGILAALVLVSVAGPLIETHLPALLGMTK